MDTTGRSRPHTGKRPGSDPLPLRLEQFIICLQNHDQIGNRALGDRLNGSIDAASYRAASALLLCAPETPLLFMGQEWAASTPFQYFTDHASPIGSQITEGRRAEFAGFSAFQIPKRAAAFPTRRTADVRREPAAVERGDQRRSPAGDAAVPRAARVPPHQPGDVVARAGCVHRRRARRRHDCGLAASVGCARGRARCAAVEECRNGPSARSVADRADDRGPGLRGRSPAAGHHAEPGELAIAFARAGAVLLRASKP